MIIEALNTEAGWSLATLADEEILLDISEIPPDTDDAYLNWITPFNLPNDSLLRDHDKDGLTHLAEFLLDKNPTLVDAPIINQDRSFIYRPDPDRVSYGSTIPSVSNNMDNWFPLAVPEFESLPDGRKKVTSTRPFLRLNFSLTN